MSKEGSVFGGILLIGGSCIGAGMLGLPIQTGISGFFPSLGLFFLACLFMTLTALLLVEVSQGFPKRVNLLTLSAKTIGPLGKHICWITYLFLFYSLLVAYISGSGNLFKTMFLNTFSYTIPVWLCSSLFVILFGWIVYFGTRTVDLFNRFLMIGKIGFFLLFIFVSVSFIKPSLLLRTNPQEALPSLPLLVIAFGFHNIIPSLTAYFQGNVKKVRQTILGGSLFALVIYILFEIIVLGIVPLDGTFGLRFSLSHDLEASQAIASLIHAPAVQLFAQGLGCFALLTSFLAQTLSLVHFLSDALHVEYKNKESLKMCALALLPPLVFSLIYPNLFFKALNFAGGICAVTLFGILPVLMLWKKGGTTSLRFLQSKPLLITILFFSFLILGIQLSHTFGL